jgi:hypothetical protein
VARDDDAFVAEVGRALAAGGGPDPARSALVRADGWESKVEELRAHLAALGARERQAPPARGVPA